MLVGPRISARETSPPIPRERKQQPRNDGNQGRNEDPARCRGAVRNVERAAARTRRLRENATVFAFELREQREIDQLGGVVGVLIGDENLHAAQRMELKPVEARHGFVDQERLDTGGAQARLREERIGEEQVASDDSWRGSRRLVRGGGRVEHSAEYKR